jgi:NAD(P)-dependent dehydrogenase (short-subunit alcohol dehydrogenase family)
VKARPRRVGPITGDASGIGRATAEQLAAVGAAIGSVELDQAKAKATIEAIAPANPRSLGSPARSPGLRHCDRA